MASDIPPTEIQRLRLKFPTSVPVFIKRANDIHSSQLPDLEKKKYLIPHHLTMGQFIFIIRKQLRISAEKSLFIFVNRTLPTTGMLMGDIYKQHKGADGLLRMEYLGQSTFG